MHIRWRNRCFDCIYIEGKELIWTPLMERKEQLSQLVNENSRIAVSRYVEGSGTAIYTAAEVNKLEGVVAKRKDSFYLMGKTNHVCVVEYMPNLINSLRQPVFKGFRDDVLPKEVQASEA